MHKGVEYSSPLNTTNSGSYEYLGGVASQSGTDNTKRSVNSTAAIVTNFQQPETLESSSDSYEEVEVEEEVEEEMEEE